MTNNPNSLISKPEWLRVKAPQFERIGNTANLLNDLNLNTVCQEASCPNIGECFASGTATFLIMGPGCTRACLLYTSPSPRDLSTSRMPSSA